MTHENRPALRLDLQALERHLEAELDYASRAWDEGAIRRPCDLLPDGTYRSDDEAKSEFLHELLRDLIASRSGVHEWKLH